MPPRGPPGAWDEEDEWYSSDRYAARHVRPPIPPPPRNVYDEYPRGRADYLQPGGGHVSYGLHRSRSQGHAPAPNVTIYNTLDADQQPRISTTQQAPPPQPASPRGRSAAENWAIEEQLAELRMEQARQRSRSRGHFDHYHHDHERHEHIIRERERSPNYQQKVELELAKERLRKKEEELEEEKLRDSLRKEYELKRAKEDRERDIAQRKREEQEHAEELQRKRIIEDNKRSLEEKERAEKAAKQRAIDEWARKRAEEEAELKAARDKAVEDYNRKKERDEAEAKAAKQKALDEYQRKKRQEEEEEAEERKRVIAEYEAKKSADEKKQKEQEEALIAKLAKKKAEQEQKEKEAYEAFLAKQKAKEEEEKAKKEAAEKEFEEKMQQRLAQSGFQYNQIQAMMKPEKQKDLSPGFLPNNPVQLGVHQPTYIKIHKDYLSVETLTYFGIPWKYDDRDPNYFILLREMESHETDALFDHTRKLRTRTTTQLLIEERGDRHSRPEYAFVRHKSKRAVSREPSPRRRRSSPKGPKMVGLKFF